MKNKSLFSIEKILQDEQKWFIIIIRNYYLKKKQKNNEECKDVLKTNFETISLFQKADLNEKKQKITY